MKKLIVIIFCLYYFSLSSYSQTDPIEFKCDNEAEQIIFAENPECLQSYWLNVFEDDFDAVDLNFKKWTLPYQCVQRDFNFSDSRQWNAYYDLYDKSTYQNNVIIEDGKLKLVTRLESPPKIGTYYDWENGGDIVNNSFNYSSAELYSKYKFTEGKFEIRCKLAKGKGFFPAFWLMGDDGSGNYNEIDIFEFWNENNFWGNYDFDDLSKHHKTNFHINHFYGGIKNHCSKTFESIDFSQDYHVFSLIWTKYKLIWLVDGEEVRSLYRYSTLNGSVVDCNIMEPFQQYSKRTIFPTIPMQIVVDFAIQPDENSPDADTPFPSSLDIDYIRYFKQIDCVSDLYVTTNEQLNLSNEVYNVIVGNNVTLSANLNVAANQQLAIIASNTITIEDETIFEDGSEVTTEIKPNICSLHGLANPGNNTNHSIDEFVESQDKNRSNSNTSNSKRLSQIDSVDVNSKNIENGNLSIKPNPSKGVFSVNKRQNNLTKIVVFNLLGEKIYETELIYDETKIDLTAHGDGMYFVECFDGDKSQMFKVFKE